MARIETYDDAVAAIIDRSSYDRGFISNPFAGDDAARLGLRRTRSMLDRLGNPERHYAIVHVAGSKGKGSTCAFIDAILRASGRRTGRYLSPHLHDWRERFVVDDTLVSEAAFVELTRETVAAAEAIEADRPELGEVTAFELTTAMALLYFRERGCDVAVIEVGLGGTLDATNIVDPIVAVITRLDYEHTAILGTTMEEIAGNKAGIIKPERPVVSAAQPAEGQEVIRRRAAACAAPLMIVGEDWHTTGTDTGFAITGPMGTIDHLRTGLVGRHQVENAALAIAAVHAAGWVDVAPDAIRAGVREAALPGRFEQVALATGHVVVIDGAHSPGSAAALAATVRDRFPDRSVTIVIGMLRDKEPVSILAPLLEIARHWIAVSPESPRSLPVPELEAHLAALDAQTSTASSVAAGIAAARRLADPIILVTGSLTTAAEARVALGLS